MIKWLEGVKSHRLTPEETTWLTLIMASSGDTVDLSAIDGFKVDKHSTGGVGDTTTLILLPLVAAAGAKVAKASGAELGHTGGTLRKVEALGMSTNLTEQFFRGSVNRIGAALTGQTVNLAPADKKLYALRDAEGFVGITELIASSIMSKKLASGADGFVLDVKYGSGALIPDFDESRKLAKMMVEIGKGSGRRVIAMLTSMAEPLGNAIGNALEFYEAVEVLNGGGPEDLVKLTVETSAHMLVLAGVVESFEAGVRLSLRCLQDGSAFNKMKEIVTNQGGDPELLIHPERLLRASRVQVPSPVSGHVQATDSKEIGFCARDLAGGTGGQAISDLHAGIWLHKKIGTWVEAGEPLATLYFTDEEPVADVKRRFLDAYTIGKEYVAPPLLIRDVLK